MKKHPWVLLLLVCAAGCKSDTSNAPPPPPLADPVIGAVDVWADSSGKFSGVIDSHCSDSIANKIAKAHPGWSAECESAPGCGMGTWRVTYTRPGSNPFTEYYDAMGNLTSCQSRTITADPGLIIVLVREGYPSVQRLERVYRAERPEGPWVPTDRYVADVLDTKGRAWRLIFDAIEEKGCIVRIGILGRFLSIPARIFIPQP